MFDNPDYAATHHALQRYPFLDESRTLLEQLKQRAATNPDYATRFKTWLAEGGTLLLRELCLPFGSYMEDRSFRESVNAIDSAHLYRFEPLPDSNQAT